ncbi:TPA_inf: hypothetical protein gp_04 [Marinomonas phage YY]|nr:TPA_inf: hypothetical protein gp_04 [Marinomonas phage YY]
MPLLAWGILALGGAVGIGAGSYEAGKQIGEGTKNLLTVAAVGAGGYLVWQAMK